MTSKRDDEIWPMKDFYCCILPWGWAECWCKRCFVHLCHYCNANISQQGSVPAHWCVHQTTELLQRETPKLTGPGLRPPVRPELMKEKVIVIFELCWAIIVWKINVFQYVQLQYLTFVNKVIIMQFKFSKGSVTTVCRWSGQISNCCIAIQILYVCLSCCYDCCHCFDEQSFIYYENRSMFVKTTTKWKTWAFVETRCSVASIANVTR